MEEEDESADDGDEASEAEDEDEADTGDNAAVCDVLLMTVVCVIMLVTCWIEVEDEADEASIPEDEGDVRGVVDLRGRIASMADEDEEREEGVMALVAA